MDGRLLDAFLEVRQGFAADRVIADPELNVKFLAACRARGVSMRDEDANRSLLNSRKRSDLADHPTQRRTVLRDISEYAFASEIAIRYLERRDDVTLDTVICSPSLAIEFDEIAGRISPGYTSLQYRWAALSLRKRRRLSPERIAHAYGAESVESHRVNEVDLSRISMSQGLYLFHDSEQTLYAGETTNLRKRLAKHLEHSDNKGLATWLWEHGPNDLHVEIHILSDSTPSRTRKALEGELIESRNPVFNVAGKPRQGERR